MPDHRKHRGPHPKDQQLFSVETLPRLRAATGDLSWLLGRGYASTSALKLVGDRYSLDARQRVAIARSACAADQRCFRQQHQISSAALRDQHLWIDGYNVLTSVEAALAGGVILHARDACYRDMASMHGNYRRVEETIPAITLLGELLAEWSLESCHWLFDQPVSNSGRLKSMLLTMAQQRDWRWEVTLVPDPDAVLVRSDAIVASADSQVLDQATCWFNLARRAIDTRVRGAWIFDLSTS